MPLDRDYWTRNFGLFGSFFFHTLKFPKKHEVISLSVRWTDQAANYAPVGR
jgi:hypothetical protein